MTRGRKPDSPEQQVEKGAPGNRISQKQAAEIRAGKSAKPVSVGNAHPPKWLKKSRKATEVWNELAPLLKQLNLLTALDAGPFARYCRYVAEWIAADQAVQKEGTWFDAIGTNGEPTKKRHPAWQACQDIEKMLRELEATFGMRPDARYKIMRDQAVAMGFGQLPLWGGEGSEPRPETDGAHPEQPATDAVSALKNYNSEPPTRIQ